jgi:LysM repeat protein
VPKGTARQLAALDSIPADKRLAWRAHRVSEGDTLASIARRYRVAEGSIASVNPLVAGLPAAGELLIIPAAQQKSVSRAPVKRRAAASSKANTRAGKATVRGATKGKAVSYTAVRGKKRTASR